MITMFFKQRVSQRVEPGISFLYRKHLGDKANFLCLKKNSKIKRYIIRNKYLNIAGNFVR